MAIIPPGFHFAPTDQELITFYLSRKAMGLPLPWNPLLEKTIYGENADPWDVFADVPWDTFVTGAGKECKNVKSVVYVFTKLSKVNGKTRIARTAGCGTWTAKLVEGRYTTILDKISRSSKESVPAECSSSSSCGESQLSNDNAFGKKRSAPEPQEVTSHKKQKVDGTSLLEEISTNYLGPPGDDNFAWTSDFGFANAAPPQQLPVPVDGCLVPEHDQHDGQKCSYPEDDPLLDLLLELEDGDGSAFGFHLDDEDASGSFFDLSSSQFPDGSFLVNRD
ncbi:UNVERIFIED_CONTAM: hypothetical protein Sradi_1347000 [Sesamum radiatum]|uniref:NAC domain-containing protein n=1 Tax=Sesamum radiatum TaxID=300843 RepID=A0AAW2UPQ5_SESRA